MRGRRAEGGARTGGEGGARPRGGAAKMCFHPLYFCYISFKKATLKTFVYSVLLARHRIFPKSLKAILPVNQNFVL